MQCFELSGVKRERMYKDTKTWNPFVGCMYDCSYCKPSFQKVLAWVGRMRGCEKCQTYEPHEHPERLDRIPNERIIFVCGDSDIAFAREDFMKEVFEAMREDTKSDRIWFVQSKNPQCLEEYLGLLPENTYLLTTLETNRDEGYDRFSRSPVPSERSKDFLSLNWDKKIVTIEPIMSFDLNPLANMIVSIGPKAVFMGYNSHPKSVDLPEPSWNEFLTLWRALRREGIRVLAKETRKDYVPKCAYRDF